MPDADRLLPLHPRIRISVFCSRYKLDAASDATGTDSLRNKLQDGENIAFAHD